MWQKFGAGIWEALAKRYPDIDMNYVRAGAVLPFSGSALPIAMTSCCDDVRDHLLFHAHVLIYALCSTHPSVASPPPSVRSPRPHLLSCTAVAIPLLLPPLPPRLHPPLRLLHPLPWPLLLTSAPGRSPLCQSPRRSKPFAGCTPL